MNQLPKVTVVIPVYNVKTYLAQCLDSVLAQTLAEIEVICGDGGSTDGSLEILQEYSSRDSRIMILSKEGSGYGQSMNECMSIAKGEYIGIVESDDYVTPDMFEVLYSKAKSGSADVVKSDFFCFTKENGCFRRWKTKVGVSPHFYGRVFCPWEEPRAFRCCLNTWCGIYRREFLEKNHIRHNESGSASFQDNGFWFQTFAFASRVTIIPKAFYHYRQDNPNSSIHSTGKVFAICEEYRFIEECLLAKGNVSPSVMQAFWAARFGAYTYALKRISPQYQLSFLRRMREDFLGAPTDAFSKREKRLLKAICDNPEEYQQTICAEKDFVFPHRLMRTVSGAYWCVVEHGWGYTIGLIKERLRRK